ncbi:hypothetical protein MKW98_029001 [Papaver atlanticum]|uniref:DUF8039 domain-containing protein n=1 Tax=Papaver atlanticum TaxID=357466 RepID=A0AAD4TLJ2_9MAGN|nr:hypothetical protein MKW98_029001 [Papaver atlanticum]
MPTHENSSWEPEYDDDEYADNETAALEALALQNVGESEDEGEDSDSSGTSSDGDSSSSDGDSSISDDESTESPEHPNTRAPNNTVESEENTVRGLTRLKKLKKKINDKKHMIEFDKFGRFKGEYKYEIASYMGVLVRRDVGLRHLKWKEAKSVLRDKLWIELLEEFDKQLEDGTLTKKPGTDSITLMFGEEHGGRVRYAGKGVTPTTYWHLPRKGASKEQIELKKQLDDERRVNQMDRERKDGEMKEIKEAMNAQAKMMSILVSQLKSQGVLKNKKTKRKKERKSPIREKYLMSEAPVRSNSPTERKESNTNSKYPECQHASHSTASKDNSELQVRLPLNSPDESQLKDLTELSTVCPFRRNVIALGMVLPSRPGQLVHGDPLKDDCVRVSVEKSILKNHCLPVPSTHLKTVEDAKGSFVAWPKEFVISRSIITLSSAQNMLDSTECYVL